MSHIQFDLQAKIDKFGYTFIGVMSDGVNPGFTYTIGLTALGMPELIMFAVPAQYAVQMLTDLIENHKKAGTAPEPTSRFRPMTGLSNLPAHLIVAETEKAEQYTFQAKYYAEALNMKPTYLQWVLPDREGNFPWDKNWDKNFSKAQPLLGSTPK